jgi:phosphate acyltransferase
LSIALDAMGGDHAPGEIVKGALEAASALSRSVILVGDPARIAELLPSPCPANLEIHPASQVVEMAERPLEAIRKKKDSSLVVATNLVREGVCGAVVTAGNTGAATAASLLSWRQMDGIHRPAIATSMPNRHGGFLLLDAGASPDVDPEHLVEFALMGRAYAEKVMGRPNPKVQLLNIGEEPGKGNSFAKQAYVLLSKHPWFAGNIEGKDIYSQPCDIVVCDAFVGNIVLKTSEGVAELIVGMIREQIPSGKLHRLLYLPLKKVMAPLRKKLDYAEVGGSPLLGLNGLCVICHGRSNAKAIRNALLLADKALANDLVATILESVRNEMRGVHG